MKLDEQTLRRADWRDGAKVTLSDGQAWTLPRPRVRWVPRVGKTGRIDYGASAGGDKNDDEALDVLLGIKEVDNHEWVRLRFELAYRRLTANYDLSPEQACELLSLDFCDPAEHKRWEPITDCLRGSSAPKPSPAT
jgi:hypothetical protein